MTRKLFDAVPSWVTLVLAILSMLGTLYLHSATGAQTLEHRMTTLEQAHTDDSQRLDRIENKLDQLVEGLLHK